MPTGNLDRVKSLAIEAALRRMLREESFSICTVDKVLRIAGYPQQDSEAYNILSALHCMDYNDMPQELRECIPEMLSRVLTLNSGGVTVDVSSTEKQTLRQRLITFMESSG